MTDQLLAKIAPPPSLGDILSSSEERIGQVDFTSRLAPEPPALPAAAALPVAELEEHPQPDVEMARDVVEAPEVEDPEPAETRATEIRTAEVQYEPDDEPNHLGMSVQEVADSAITRIRAACEASHRQLESIEAEAARRCELITAQAELDAELIRLHARREAHAIITAARMRSGGGTDASPDSQSLTQIGETLSRFAESLETAVASTPETTQDSVGQNS